MAQLNKIKTHRAWLLNPPKHKPSREEFGLPIAAGTLSPDDQNRIEQSPYDLALNVLPNPFAAE